MTANGNPSSACCDILVKDGAMGTLLEKYVDLSKVGSMWSSSVLLADPDLIQRVHSAYVSSGCDVLLTCTYQMHPAGCAAAEKTMPQLVDLAVQVASAAISQTSSSGRSLWSLAGGALAELAALGGRSVLLAGSLGPFGCSIPSGHEYLGDYDITEERIQSFHGSRLGAFVAEADGKLKVDLLLLETIPRLDEALGIAAWMREQSSILRVAPVCFTFVPAPVVEFFTITTKDHHAGSKNTNSNKNEKGTNEETLEDWWSARVASIQLPDGYTFTEAATQLYEKRPVGLIGMGCNCGGPLEVCLAACALLQMRRHTDERPLALFICPNSGEVYADGVWFKSVAASKKEKEDHTAKLSTTTTAEPTLPEEVLRLRLAKGEGTLQDCAAYCKYILRQRATTEEWLFDGIVCGACCRSTPDDIASLKALKS